MALKIPSRRGVTRKPKKSPDQFASDEAAFQTHLQRLQIQNEVAYMAWCDRHGFPRRKLKTAREREREILQARQIAAEVRLTESRRTERSLAATLDLIFSGKLAGKDVSNPVARWICDARDARLLGHKGTRDAFRRLLLTVARRGALLNLTPVIQQFGRVTENSYPSALLSLADYSAHWIRSPETWRPQSHNAFRQFQSLARHLLARWPIPDFMDSVWFQGTDPRARKHREWYLRLGCGVSIRTASLPITYTRRMAHHFMEAPADYTVDEALRWGQIQAWGGNARLVRAICTTRLRNSFDNDQFWTSVIQFFIANPMLDLTHVGPIVDYLHNQKFVWQEVWTAPGTFERQPPPQVNLTMKGRTVEALLRNVTSWHKALSKTGQGPAQWQPSGIQGLTYVEGSRETNNLKIWRIIELLNASELIAEGKDMRHCVASYAQSCNRGYCSIWALELEQEGQVKKVLTLEVRNASRTLVQARGRYNALPDQKARDILHRWAARAQLAISNWV